ncbi:SAICAR synthase-like protein [Neoconidiobolus thromboides FSU 785]|nr:SAICAR synthase-like protein [Neoconidiobolus thromboides FSU 785]
MLEQVSNWEDAKQSWKQYRRFSKRPNKIGSNDEDEDRVLIGTRVAEGHQNYTLMYNMLTGIRVSVSRCSAKPMKSLSTEDFIASNKLAFDVHITLLTLLRFFSTGNELVPSSKYDFKFKDYAPNVFRQIRTIFGIDPAEYLMSLTHKYIVSELFSPGKSKSFFYYSRDYRFIIKTVHHVEHRFMRKILPDYFKYIQENPDTLLTRIYGLHRVKVAYSRKIHFVVMANIFPPNKDIHESYDLKGSTLGRKVDESIFLRNPIIPMKDLNWMEKDRRFHFGPQKRNIFLEQLEKDAKLLKTLKIMDYSLLVGIHFKDRGNQDGIRDRSLSIFQPDLNKVLQGGQEKGTELANMVRRTIAVSDPVALSGKSLKGIPNEAVFYRDSGGFSSSDENDMDGDIIYYFGIIDILTPYNYAKKVEHYWKSMSQDKNAISAVHPKVYANRFVNFISDSAIQKVWESCESSSNSPKPESKQIRQRRLTLKNQRRKSHYSKN